MVIADFADPAAVAAAATELAATRPIDILVNNAGIIRARPRPSTPRATGSRCST